MNDEEEKLAHAYALIDAAFTGALSQAFTVAVANLASTSQEDVKQRLVRAINSYAWARNVAIECIKSGEINLV